MSSAKKDADFVRKHADVVRTELLPEIALHLARDPFGIFLAAEKIKAERPYWAFAWSGGQGLARWLLDNPAGVAGKRVIDIGAGSGISAIAALKAGAASAIANDTDAISCAAATLNAAANNVPLAISRDDLLADEPDADLILIGDLFYEPELVTRVTAFLARAARRGMPVLFGDRVTARRPPVEFELLEEYAAPLTPNLEIGYVETGRVWRLKAS